MRKINFNFISKFNILNFISLLLSIIIILAIIYVGFWELNIFKKEIEISPELKEIQSEINYLSKLNFLDLANEMKNKLPQPQILSEPTLTSESIGKNSWFE
ncbi:MAG: hypothetical protein KatS3mg095_0223 [Candidatus Parcubacteria bacterium]|nr:MAG: hypothetical protein KatS3mg095_0223 [Candidatus Parcubacteria bacterium]